MSDAISIEATNKIRVSLGLKPLPVPGGGSHDTGLSFKDDSGTPPADDDDPGSTLESRQAAGYDNWKKLQDEAEEKAKRMARNEAIKNARDASRRFAKLEGKGLGEEDAEVEVDTKTWLIQQKKRQKKLEKARKLEQELAEREQQAEYTAADLAGLKVAHGLGDIEEGAEQVLTLKDTTIDENEEEGDELENVELKESEALSERMELKKKKPVYNPNELEDSAEASILGHYDEEIEGKRRKRFTLDGQGNKAEARANKAQQANGRPGAKLFSLDIEEITGRPASDYLDASEVKMRKPKKKKARATRQKAADDDDMFPMTKTANDDASPDPTAMQVDSTPTNGAAAAPQKRSYDDASFADDDDLQASLAAQRRAALKKRKKTKPEDIARQMREEASAPATPAATGLETDQAGEEEGGLVIDETSEFVANIQKPTVADRDRPRRRSTSKPAADTPADRYDDEDGDVDMDYHHHDEDSKLHPPPPTTDLPSTGLDDEATLNNGIGATLSLLTSRGLLKPTASTSASATDPSAPDLNALDRTRANFLLSKTLRLSEAEQRARAQRERDRASGKLALMSARERELYSQNENRLRDQYESRQLQEVFAKEYRPNVELKYTDEFGRHMGQKEAFKHLSHMFHGKGSGKGKMEKRIKKMEGEKRAEARAGLGGEAEGGGGLGKAAIGEGRKTGSAGVRLG